MTLPGTAEPDHVKFSGMPAAPTTEGATKRPTGAVAVGITWVKTKVLVFSDDAVLESSITTDYLKGPDNQNC
jgi:hypothetical protein